MMGKDASIAADTLRMKSDSIPLFTTKTLISARVSSTPASVESSAQATTSSQNSRQPEQAEAKVIASKLQPQPENSANAKITAKPEWQLTLEIDGKTLKVNSRLPLPVDSRVTVSVSQDTHGKPQLNLDAIELASVKPSVPNQTPENMANSTKMQSASNPTTSLLQILRGAVSSKPQAANAIVSQWLASRLPAATQTQAIPSVSSAVNALLTQQLPESVRQSLSQFIAAQPERPALNQGSQIESAVRNSPQQYERQLLQQVAQTLLPSSEIASAIKHSPTKSLFQQLWQSAPSIPLPKTGQNSGASMSAETQTIHAAPNRMNIGKNTNGLSLREGLRQLFRPAINANHSAANVNKSNKPLRTLSDAMTALLNKGTDSEQKSLINAGQVQLGDDHPLTGLLTHNLKAALAKAFVDWQGQLTGARASASLPLSFSAAADDIPDAFRLLQSTLAQHEVEQFRTVQSSSEQLQTSLALLYRDGNQLRDIPMHMQREDGGQESDAHEVKRQSRWRIKLHFNLTELGPLDIDLDLRMPTMSAIFWSQQPDTLARLNQAIAPLRQRLTELGVKVETLQAKHGQRPPQSHGNIQHSLVDIHT
jgi:hypothetical protein